MGSITIVDGNTNLPQTAQNQGALEIRNGAVIENANNAISTNGGIIQAENATFKNNRKSVEFLEYQGGGGISSIPQNVSYFKNCTFVQDTTNQFTSDPLPHITMCEVTGVKIRGCTFENSLPNMYDNRKAIFTLDAGYTIDDNCTYFSFTQCACTGTSTPSVFNGFDRAIESTNSTKQYAIRIERNHFDNNRTGIFLKGKNSFRITDVNMSLNHKFDSNLSIGIHLQTCTNYKIEGNEIYSNGSDYPKGIYVTAAGSDENTIYRNSIHNTFHGVYVGSNCHSVAANQKSFPLTGLQLKCNDFIYNHNDIHICPDATFRATQGSISKGADNLFSPNATYNFYLENKNCTVDYYYDPNVSRKYPDSITNNIAPLYAGASTCVNTVCQETMIKKETKGDAMPEIDPHLFFETYKELNQHFTEMMRVFYEKGYDKILNDYYNGVIENEELLHQAKEYHAEILEVTENMSELSRIALFHLKTDSLIDLNQIRDWYDEIYTLSAKYSLAETYYQLEKYEEGFNTLALIPKKYNLNEEEMMEHNNYVSLYDFKNKIRESGRNISELNEAEIEQLVQFAKTSNGLSSVLAQGTLCFFYDICLEEEDAEGGKQKAESNDEMMMSPPLAGELKGVENDEMMNQSVCEKLLENITVAPNPTTGELKIESGKLKIESVEVFDIYGKNQTNFQFSTFNFQLKIDISNLSAGLYFVKIKTSVGEVVKKVVKQ